MGDKEVRVSDWSQKYKIALYILGLVLAVWFGKGVLEKLDVKSLGGGAVQNALTSSSTVQVVGSSSTLIVATSTGPEYICNTGLNEANIAFASSISTSSELGGLSRGLRLTTTTLPNACAGPFEYQGTHAAHTQTGTTSIVIIWFGP